MDSGLLITKDDYEYITAHSIDKPELAEKVTRGMRLLCICFECEEISNSIKQKRGVDIFNACENKMKEIFLKVGIDYPSSDVQTQGSLFGGFPKFQHMEGPGLTENILDTNPMSGMGSFLFGATAWGVGALIKYGRKEKQRKQNRITNFVLIYNRIINMIEKSASN
ncbi:MAG: hypothetical protein LBM65_01860 [Oscillospiraceae bacterium]|jgi:hypothetical protein|nr:hypothetical protein [Oscillospiraceae bacterium]